MLDLSDEGEKEFYKKTENIRLGITLSKYGLRLKKELYRRINDYENVYESMRKVSRSLGN